MTFQERWAEGPPVGEAPKAREISELLTPGGVREMLEKYSGFIKPDPAAKLCRDYLTLWDRHERLKEAITKEIIWRLDKIESELLS